MTRPLRILTWNVHGGYLASLAHIGHTIYLPVRNDPRDGYGGRPREAGLPPTLVEVPARRGPESALVADEKELAVADDDAPHPDIRNLVWNVDMAHSQPFVDLTRIR